jgi:hypothetical protein
VTTQSSGPMHSSPAESHARGGTSRRAFLAGAGATALGAGMLGGVSEAFGRGDLTRGDAAILRFLSAAEILETDVWQQ